MLLLVGLLAGLVGWAVSNLSFRHIAMTLGRLEAWQIGVLLGIDLLVIMCTALRWWLITSATSRAPAFLRLVGYRLAAFSASYFTFGPQLGGEPLQVILLSRHGLGVARATSAVVLDKLLEILANIAVLGVGVLGAWQMRMLVPAILASPFILPALALAATCILAYAAMLLTGARPISSTLGRRRAGSARPRWLRLTTASERLTSTFARRHPRALLGAATASLAAWIGMALEYVLLLDFLGLHADLWPALSGLAASMLAFLVPVPGGLGALEASQVLVLGSLGIEPAEAIAVALAMRARDLVNAGAGALLLAKGLLRAT